MTLKDALRQLRYWERFPPVHELLHLLTRAYTDWRPAGERPRTQEEADAAHRRSLEKRWKHGALNVRQLLEMTGGSIRLH